MFRPKRSSDRAHHGAPSTRQTRIARVAQTAQSSASRGLPIVTIIGGLVSVFAPGAIAQTGESLLLKPWTDDQPFESRGAIRWSFPSPSPDHPHSLTEMEATGRVRLDSSHKLNPTVGFDLFRLEHREEGTSTPRVLSDSSVAFATPIAPLGSWFVGALVGVGYAGTAPFKDGKAIYAKGSVMTGRDLDDRSSLTMWLQYDGNHTLFPDVPIPGIAYSAHPSDNLEYLLGFPLNSITWHPVPAVTLEASWSLPVSIEALAELRVAECLTLFASYRNETHAFHVPNLPNHDRLFFDEQRVEIGARLGEENRWSLEAGIGFAFARRFQQGFDDRNRSTITRIENRPFIGAAFSLSF